MALLARLNGEPDERKRVYPWRRLQALMYEEVPIVRPGTVFSMMLSRKTSRVHAEAQDGLCNAKAVR